MKILLVKTSSLGDIIQSFPVVALLKKNYPQAEIDWVVEKRFSEILHAHPDLSSVIEVDMKKWKKHPIKFRKEMMQVLKTLRKKNYDLLFDFQGNIKSACITRAVHAKEKVGMSFKTAPEWPNAMILSHRYSPNPKDPISLQYLFLAKKHLQLSSKPPSFSLTFCLSKEDSGMVQSQLKKGHRTMICPGSQWENKKLSLPTWIELLKHIQRQTPTHFYLIWGNSREEQEALALHAQFPSESTVIPKMSLPQWQYLMAHMDVIYTVDSSALHLAATTNIPTYSFFGPSNATIYKPPLNRHYAFQGICPYGKTFTKRCPALRNCKTGACLKEVSPLHLLSSLNP